MIKVLFFAQVKELVGTDMLELESEFATAEQLRAHLVSRGEKWALALAPGKLLVAINQQITGMSAPIAAGDEIAFFPPVTGG